MFRRTLRFFTLNLKTTMIYDFDRIWIDRKLTARACSLIRSHGSSRNALRSERREALRDDPNNRSE